jgi:hypothetical protein
LNRLCLRFDLPFHSKQCEREGGIPFHHQQYGCTLLNQEMGWVRAGLPVAPPIAGVATPSASLAIYLASLAFPVPSGHVVFFVLFSFSRLIPDDQMILISYYVTTYLHLIAPTNRWILSLYEDRHFWHFQMEYLQNAHIVPYKVTILKKTVNKYFDQ